MYSTNLSTVFLVDDHPLYRAGTRALIANSFSAHALEFSDLNSAAAALDEYKPSMVMLDIELPDGSGLSRAQEFLHHECKPRVVILTTHRNPEYLTKAKDLGLHGYLFKDDDPDSIIACLKSDVAFFMSEYVAQIMKQHDVNLLSLERLFQELTAREREVLYFLASDLTSKEIGEKLGVSFRTIQNHRANIKSKFQIERNSQLLKLADHFRPRLTQLLD